ncbi:rhomboid family intramembrane serine protease [Bifidobacterium avesanii]|uniref:Rhomboid family intramembrane serine protease n=1 Tax=Bifidobacterium avesanii TaxID=1798157 RepID=A0A7K3TKV2_9BIFI|nr:rhomboid family intramembrane serine protease [Bifidobacterium avesanii]KAB8286743.1 rhomboid family intramembrane serine protease [Bifidobacterium avesanii]NEG79359.1 rhomboid family intramembrane serine protease [Bifidobacterium avesanii]
MRNGRFTLFPNTPSPRDLFNRRALAYQWRSGGPVVTEAIMALCVAVWAVEILLRLVAPSALNAMLSFGMFSPLTAMARPWTFLTSMFLHEPGIMHVLFNMLTLWCVGPLLERLLGHWPFLAMYLISGVGGGMGLMVAAALLPSGAGWLTAAYGASGALFGLFAAMLVVFRRVGADIRSMLVWMAINFAMPLVVPGIAWEAHVGGFVVGGVLALLLTSGLKALRGRSIGARMGVYGTIVCVATVAVCVACDLGNPLGGLAGSLL